MLFQENIYNEEQETGLDALKAFNNRRNKMRSNECDSSGSEEKNESDQDN